MLEAALSNDIELEGKHLEMPACFLSVVFLLTFLVVRIYQVLPCSAVCSLKLC